MNKLFFVLFIFAIFLSAQDNSKYTNMVKQREGFFTEAFAQTYDITKIKIDSKSGLESIDFCSFPPDRSLVYGALQNGRFHGNKVNDLPFTCNNTSGAKKFFIKNANIKQSFYIIKTNFPQFLLPENLPKTNSSEAFSINNKQNELHYIFQSFDTKSQNYILSDSKIIDRLWIIYTGGVARYTLIFTQKGSNTEVIMQYLNL